MPSSQTTKMTGLIIGVIALTATSNAAISAIRANLSDADEQRAEIVTGDRYVITGDDPTPSTYLDDDTTNPIETLPTLPGTEYCTGNTGALLCTVTIKLTGSGGRRNYNAGSFVCGTSTCSILSARVFTEAVPVGSERLYGGWTGTPLTGSAAQVFNWYAASSGATIIGSGAYVAHGANATNIEKDMPPGTTFKFTWALGDGTEDHSRYKAAAVVQYYKYYNP